MGTKSEKVEQVTFWRGAILQDMTSESQRLDRSLSWCAQRAWQIARAEILSVASEHPQAQNTLVARYASRGAEPRKQTLFFPADMLAEIKATAAARNRSLSSILEQAWCLSVSEIEKTPAS